MVQYRIYSMFSIIATQLSLIVTHLNLNMIALLRVQSQIPLIGA